MEDLVIVPRSKLYDEIRAIMREEMTAFMAGIKAQASDEYLNTEQALKLLNNISRGTLDNYVKEGLITVYKIKGRNNYKRAELENSRKSLQRYKKVTELAN